MMLRPSLNPKLMIFIGVMLMILGVVLPLLMIIKVIPSTFFLGFFSYSVSLLGMILAFLGLFSVISSRRK